MTTMLALRLEWGGERINMYINGIRKRKMVFGYRGEWEKCRGNGGKWCDRLWV